MMTLTGTLFDWMGNARYCAILFVPTSNVTYPAGQVGTSNALQVLTDRTTGSFSTSIAAGTYDVIIKSSPQETRFSITIPLWTGTITLANAAAASLVMSDIVLEDLATGTNYAISVINGQMQIAETEEAADGTIITLTDKGTGGNVTLQVINGQLQIVV